MKENGMFTISGNKNAAIPVNKSVCWWNKTDLVIRIQKLLLRKSKVFRDVLDPRISILFEKTPRGPQLKMS
jgi:hypothetical protein